MALLTSVCILILAGFFVICLRFFYYYYFYLAPSKRFNLYSAFLKLKALYNRQ